MNQLIGFTDGETTASYKYNADGLRTSKTVDGKTINHIWDGNKQIVVDMDDSDWYSAEVYVRGTNLLAKFSKQSGNVKTDYQYYTQNAHGDVVNLTDSTGAITKSYKYDAFGVEQNVDDADDNAFRYCGEYFDAETGTIYLRARYYNPTTGRFISRDSYAGKNTDPLSLNLYTYCCNNPIIGTDPSGHFGIIATMLIGSAIGVASTYVSDVIGNIANGEKGADIFKPTSSIGTYIGSAISGAIPGSGAVSMIARPLVSTAVKYGVDCGIRGDKFKVSDAAIDFTIGLAGEGVAKGINNKLDKIRPRNYSTFRNRVTKWNDKITQEGTRALMRKVNSGVNIVQKASEILVGIASNMI